MKTRNITLFTAIAAAAAFASSAQATTVIFNNLKVDNAEEFISNGFVNLGSSDLELGNENENDTDPGKNQIVGLRFQSVSIPNGAIITSASIEFTAFNGNTGTSPILDIWGHKTADAAAFTAAAYNLSLRDETTNTVTWSGIPAWTDNSKYSTPDLKTIIQEIVNQETWTSSNALAIMLAAEATTDETRRASSGDNMTALTVEYTVPEPSTMSLLAIGGIALIRRRRRA